MNPYIKDNRLTIEADEGMLLTDGAELFVSKYEFPVGVEENNLLHEITEAEYNAKLETETFEGV
jgi:hypothetical protein